MATKFLGNKIYDFYFFFGVRKLEIFKETRKCFGSQIMSQSGSVLLPHSVFPLNCLLILLIYFSGFATPESVIKDLLHKPYGHFNIVNLAVFTVIYFIISCYTYGLAISSGLFIPCLLVGAGWGRLIGIFLIKYASFDVGDPGKFALMGAVSQLSGVVRISVTVATIVTEATGILRFLKLCIH